MIPRKSLAGSKKKKKAPKEAARESVYFDEELEPVEVEMIPEDQLDLTKAELDEEFTKTLTSLDPNQPAKITYFNFKKGAFESKPNSSHIAIHVNVAGVIWSAKEKEELEKLEKEKEETQKVEEKDEKAPDENDQDEENQAAEEEKAGNEDEDKEAAEKKEEKTENDDDEKEEDQQETKKKKEVLVKNQFNFSDRASQTFNEPLRDREVQTEPAPKSVFSQNANPSAIRDEYLKNLLKLKQQQIEEENKKKKSGFASSSNATAATKSSNATNSSESKIQHHDEADALIHSKAMFRALKIMERVAVLNANSSSYHDFRYYSESDYKRGSFLNHLWRFKYAETGNKMVTCLEWNRSHLDLFGVGYGSYDFNQQTNGMICIYSLKSTAFPEKIIECESGVMCMSFHPKYSSLICVGSYDGSVAVYDIRNRDDSPIYSSENPESHHSDPVTDIKWYTDELQHDLVFYSISSDSEIKIWKMSQNELNHESFIKLKSPPVKIEEDGAEKEKDTEEEWSDLPALCSCFDFNPFMEHLYLVGTEDGHIMECSKTYNDGYTKIYVSAHFMNVYGVCWNPFHSKIFLSCSEDWTIKLWEMEKTEKEKGAGAGENSTAAQTANGDNEHVNEPIITYDLGCSVNDVVWAPFSSTIFAAVTNDGKLHVFDLSQNKNAPLCSQQITKKSKHIRLTRVSFPVGYPLIIVGDEKGNVFALKLSPNLYLNKVKHREILKSISQNMFDNQDFKQKEKQKLVNVLNVTGKKVFDVIQHFSPKPKKPNPLSPKNKKTKSYFSPKKIIAK